MLWNNAWLRLRPALASLVRWGISSIFSYWRLLLLWGILNISGIRIISRTLRCLGGRHLLLLLLLRLKLFFSSFLFIFKGAWLQSTWFMNYIGILNLLLFKLLEIKLFLVKLLTLLSILILLGIECVLIIIVYDHLIWILELSSILLLLLLLWLLWILQLLIHYHYLDGGSLLWLLIWNTMLSWILGANRCFSSIILLCLGKLSELHCLPILLRIRVLSTLIIRWNLFLLTFQSSIFCTPSICTDRILLLVILWEWETLSTDDLVVIYGLYIL